MAWLNSNPLANKRQYLSAFFLENKFMLHVALRETAALGRGMNYQLLEQAKTVRLALQKTADIERKARLFVLLADTSLHRP